MAKVGDKRLDVIVVGAGAAGVGVGVALRQAGVKRFVLLDRHEAGGSFRRWPAETRFITPSFNTSGFGPPDLNAVAPFTSPALYLGREHPSGARYADYLVAVARHYKLHVETGADVVGVTPLGGDAGFEVRTSQWPLRTRFVVWAAGEFAYPRVDGVPGAKDALTAPQVPSWSDVLGDDLIVIGGAETGIDAAVHLVAAGRRVRVLDAGAPWASTDSDPSRGLSPFTQERLEQAMLSQRLELIAETPVTGIRRLGGGWLVEAGGRQLTSDRRPIFATGYVGGSRLISELFAPGTEGRPLVSEEADESTRHPGLFLAGPEVRHDKVIFCFIYKFRQRFAIVARAIARRLGLDTAAFEAAYKDQGMLLEDLTCCDTDCAC